MRRWWSRLRSRDGGGERQPDADLRSTVRQAIMHTRGEQAKLAAAAADMFVHSAEAQRAMDDQHQVLVGAAGQIRHATTLARQAARRARNEPGVDPAPYELTADGLQTQLAVVEASMGQLERLRAGAQLNVVNAKAVLSQNARSLDGALRAEIGLLGRLDQLERDRVIAALPRRRSAP